MVLWAKRVQVTITIHTLTTQAACRRNWGVRTYREFQNHLQKFDSDMTAVFELNQNQSHQQTIEEYSLKVHGSSLLGLAPS